MPFCDLTTARRFDHARASRASRQRFRPHVHSISLIICHKASYWISKVISKEKNNFPNCKKMPRLNLEERYRILGLLETGISQTAVARRFNVSRSTVVRLVHRFRATGSAADHPRSGAPRVTSQRQDQYIRVRHLRNRFLNAAETASVIIGTRGRPVHRRTISRRLRERGVRAHRPYRGPILTQRHRHNRVLFARNRRRQNWQNVVFSDESRFNLYHTDGRQRVYRRRGERFCDNTVIEHDRFGGGGVMVWGAINHNLRSRLVICDGNLTARRYVDEILRPVLIPLLRRQPNANQLTFQHDNARPHSAAFTTNFLRQNGVDVMDWPSLSPDLNPIEHLWDELGRRIRRRQRPPQTLRELRQALEQEWDNIPRATIRRLCRSMPSRLRECLGNNGGHTRY